MTLELNVNSVITTITSSPGTSIMNTPSGSLPQCFTPIIIFGSCPGEANTYDDWVAYDFLSLPIGIPVIVTIISGNTVFTTDACGMYPASTGIVIIPPPPSVSDITTCGGPGNTVGPIIFPQSNTWTNDNTAIGLSASGTGDIPAFTPANVSTTQVANITISNTCGSSTFTITVNPSPVTDFTTQVGGGIICPGQPVNFTDLSTPPSGDFITSWNWDFGDGSPPSNQQNPTHTFPLTPSSFNVTLTTTSSNGCSTNTTITLNFGGPSANFIAPSVCEGSISLFTDSSTPVGTITGWAWDFDNNGVVDDVTQNPNFTYLNTGNYMAELLVTATGGCLDSITIQVVVNPNPVANFTVTNECLGFTSTFNDLSSILTGNIIGWQWDFGDGVGTSTLQNPTYIFSAPDTFTVTLVVTSDSGCTSIVDYPIVVYPLPVVGFTTANVCLYDSAVFTGISTISSGSVTSWQWDFGDGNTAFTQNTIHLYSADNTYNVTLIVASNNSCLDTIIQPIQIHPIPVAGFSTNNVCLYDPPVFTDTSTVNSGTIISWNWDFGDGTSIIQNPTHPYLADGTYNVSLLVTTNNICVDTVVQSLIIYPVPATGFTTGNVCLYDAALFIDVTTINAPDNIITWQWNFGDGNTSTLQNTANFYGTDGAYNVTLLVTSNNGCLDSIVQPIQIHPIPVAGFSTNNVCLYNPAVFADASTISGGSNVSWNWNYGDSNTSTQQNPSYLYAASGSYNVTLLVTTDSGCVDSITKTIAIHYIPLANFVFTDVCLNDTTVFNDISQITVDSIVTWQWDFGDGVGASTLQNPIYVFNTSGIFIVTLDVTSDSGCTSTVGYQVEVFPLPVADFTTANVCLYDAAVFTDVSTISSGSVTSWQWDFGDLAPGETTQNATHLYSADSTYNVTLIVASNNSCLDTIVQSIEIYPIPVAVFSTNNVCLYDPAVFADASTISSGSIVSWNWDFGDGTSIIQNPTHLYSTDGTYYVSLLVTTNNSCVDTVVDTLIIYPVPTANFTTSPVCLYDAAVFTDVSTINAPDNIVSWQWDFGDGPPAGGSTNQNPTYNYAIDGLYNVQLTVTSNNGCTKNTALTIEIYPLPVMNFISDTFRGCEPLCVNFSDLTTITSGTINFWNWDFGDGNTSTGQNPENCYMAINVNTTRISTVTLIATSSNGCLDTLIMVDMITTWPNPIAEFMAEPQPTTILAPVISFTDQSQGDTIAWAWDFDDGFTDSIQHPVHEYSDTGAYIVEQIIVNQFSCPDTFYRTVTIRPDYVIHVPNAFTPNNKDGINDEFFPQGIGIDEKNFEMYIYDRWGDLIFETNDINKPWDGRSNNGSKIAQQDVYIWVIFTRDMQGKRHKYVGHVTLIR